MGSAWCVKRRSRFYCGTDTPPWGIRMASVTPGTSARPNRVRASQTPRSYHGAESDPSLLRELLLFRTSGGSARGSVTGVCGVRGESLIVIEGGYRSISARSLTTTSGLSRRILGRWYPTARRTKRYRQRETATRAGSPRLLPSVSAVSIQPLGVAPASRDSILSTTFGAAKSRSVGTLEGGRADG